MISALRCIAVILLPLIAAVATEGSSTGRLVRQGPQAKAEQDAVQVSHGESSRALPRQVATISAHGEVHLDAQQPQEDERAGMVRTRHGFAISTEQLRSGTATSANERELHTMANKAPALVRLGARPAVSEAGLLSQQAVAAASGHAAVATTTLPLVTNPAYTTPVVAAVSTTTAPGTTPPPAASLESTTPLQAATASVQTDAPDTAPDTVSKTEEKQKKEEEDVLLLCLEILACIFMIFLVVYLGFMVAEMAGLRKSHDAKKSRCLLGPHNMWWLPADADVKDSSKWLPQVFWISQNGKVHHSQPGPKQAGKLQSPLVVHVSALRVSEMSLPGRPYVLKFTNVYLQQCQYLSCESPEIREQWVQTIQNINTNSPDSPTEGSCTESFGSQTTSQTRDNAVPPLKLPVNPMSRASSVKLGGHEGLGSPRNDLRHGTMPTQSKYHVPEEVAGLLVSESSSDNDPVKHSASQQTKCLTRDRSHDQGRVQSQSRGIRDRSRDQSQSPTPMGHIHSEMGSRTSPRVKIKSEGASRTVGYSRLQSPRASPKAPVAAKETTEKPPAAA